MNISGVLYVAPVTSAGTTPSGQLRDTSYNTRVDALAAWIDAIVEAVDDARIPIRAVAWMMPRMIKPHVQWEPSVTHKTKKLTDQRVVECRTYRIPVKLSASRGVQSGCWDIA